MLCHPKDSNLSVPTMVKVGDYTDLNSFKNQLLTSNMKLIIVSVLRTKTNASTPNKVLVASLGKASLIEVPDSASSFSILFLKNKVLTTKTKDNPSRLG